VLDFGLARFTSELSEESSVTPSGFWVGTPDYIAPEQATNSKNADIRADIFSLGCTLYFLLTGRMAFPGQTATEKLVARLTGQPVPLAQVWPGFPPGLDEKLVRMMARDPADRYQTPAEVAAALEPFTRDGNTPRILPLQAAGDSEES